MSGSSGELSPEGLEFIKRCLEAREGFGVWIKSCNEQEIKASFPRFAGMMKNLDEIIEEAEHIVRQDPMD